MQESNTGTEKFIIIDRLVFFSALILTIVIATATTTHPYKSMATLDNPAELLSFERTPEEDLEVPIAGDVTEEKTEAHQETMPETKPEEEQPTPQSPEETPAVQTTYTTKPSTAPAPVSTTSKPSQKSTIDWNTVHVDDNGENFDNGEVPGAITPAGSEFPAQPTPTVEENTPVQPSEPSENKSTETGSQSTMQD